MADYTVSITLRAVDQFTSTLQGLNLELQNVATNSANAAPTPSQTSGWDNFKNTVQTAMGALQTFQQVAGQVYEFGQLGESVHAVKAAFDAFEGGPEAAAESLNILREATSGVLTDVELMQTSTRMRGMGLGETTEEIAELIGMAQQLGGVMSPQNTAAQNIDNFTLMLANNSKLRLDTFGISAAAVRDRMAELKEEGYDTSEAFRMATLEQGRVSLERLGDAATIGATAVDRLATRWENAKNDIAESAAGILNTAATTIDQMLTIMAIQTQGPSEELLAQQQADYEAVAGQQIIGPGAGVHEVLYGNQAGASNVEGGRLLEASGSSYSGSMLFGAANDQLDMLRNMELVRSQIENSVAPLAFGVRTEIEANASAAGQSVSELAEAARLAEDEWRKMAGTIAATDFTVLDEAALSADLLGARMESAGRIISTSLSDALSLYDMAGFESTTTVGGASFARGDIGGQALFSPEEAQAAQDMATYYNNLLTDATLLHEQGLISDTELANVSATATEAERLAAAAEQGAAAFENMSLSQAFGIEGLPGMQGEMAADVLAYMNEQGAGGQQVQEWELATGTETLANMAYENTIVPMISDIAATYGAEAGAAAIANMQTFLQNAQLTGMSDSAISAGMAGATGYDYITQTGTGGDVGMGGLDAEFQTLQSTAGDGLDSQVEIAQDMAVAVHDAADGMTEMSNTAVEVSTQMTNAASQGDRLYNRLVTMAGTTVRVNVRVDTSGAHAAITAMIRDIIGEQGGGSGGSHPGGGGP